MKSVCCAIFFICFLSAQIVFAKATFGPEFEFISSKINRAWNFGDPVTSVVEGEQLTWSGKEQEEARRFAMAVQAKCFRSKLCRVKKIKYKYDGEYLVTFTDGWWFRISYDPACIEIQAKPQTLKQLRDNIQRMNRFIFSTAYQNNFYTDVPDGSGHVNVGFYSLFGNDTESVKRFASFFVDFQNYPELSNGALGIRDLGNARPLTLLSDAAKKKVNALLWKLMNQEITDQDFLSQLQWLVGDYDYSKKNINHTYDESINFDGVIDLFKSTNSNKDAPVELRTVRAQDSANDFLLMAELIQLRFNFLEKNYFPIIPLNFYDRKYTDIDLVSRFYLYVTEAGGDFKKFKQLLPFKIRKMKPDSFVLNKEMDLNKYSDFLVLKKYVPYVISSPLVNAKLTDLLMNPSNFSKKYYDRLIKELKESAKEIKKFNPSLSKLYKDRLDIISAGQGSCSALFSRSI